LGQESFEIIHQMLDIRYWSSARVVVTSALWVALNVALAAGIVYLQFRKLSGPSTRSAGIYAVSIGFNEIVFAVLVLYLLGPPILLTVVWYLARRF
jgi:hypothetical protein